MWNCTTNINKSLSLRLRVIKGGGGGGGGGSSLLLHHLALAAAGSGAAVLEPVEDVGVADGAEFLEKLPYSDGFVLWRVNHATVEDGLEYEDLFWLWSPP